MASPSVIPSLTLKPAGYYAPDPAAAYMRQEVYGRQALYLQINSAKESGKPNPWRGVVDRLQQKSNETFDMCRTVVADGSFQYNHAKHRWVNTPDVGPTDIDIEAFHEDEPKICDDVRAQAILHEILHKPCNFQTAHPIRDLLKMKAKYSKDHPSV